jgi:ankyrin repeat protein
MQQKSEFAELLTLKPIRWQWRSGKQNPSKVAPLHVTQSECDRVYASNAIIASEIKQRRSNEQAPALDRPSFAQLEEDIEKRRLASEKLQKIIDLLALGDDFGVAQLLLGDNNLVHFRYGIEFSSEEGKEEVMMSGETLLHLGCRKKNHRVVQLLVDFNSDVNARSLEPHYNTPLHIAAMADDREIIDILLANGAESKVVNYREETAFLCSCKAGAEKTCQQILELNILGDINVRNCEGRSALWFACSTGLRDIAIELIKLGASLTEEPDSNQQSLLHAACR